MDEPNVVYHPVQELQISDHGVVVAKLLTAPLTLHLHSDIALSDSRTSRVSKRVFQIINSVGSTLFHAEKLTIV